MKIYIIGPVGSGKTTLAKKISKKNNLPFYELDKIIWDDEKGIKRSPKYLKKEIKKITKKASWIVEDVGRDTFQELYPLCTKIYYLKIPIIILYFRVIKRWLKQIINIEKSNYPQNLNTLKDMIKWVKTSKQKESTLLNKIIKYNYEIITISKYKKMLKYNSR